MTSDDLYKAAYAKHYDGKAPFEAKELYEQLLAEFPTSKEAGYARSQLKNILKLENADKEKEALALRNAEALEEARKERAEAEAKAAEEARMHAVARQKAALGRPLPDVQLTTAPTLEGYAVLRTLDIVTSECVLGTDIFDDFVAGFSDVFGGRSGTYQQKLKQARTFCLSELREAAASQGANAVIAVSLNYSELSGKGKQMLMLVATGTAVWVAPLED